MRSPRHHGIPAPNGGQLRSWLSLALVGALPVAVWMVERTGLVQLYLLVLVAESLLDRCRPQLRSLAAGRRAGRARGREARRRSRVREP